jgi:hypothetical protein
MYVCMRIYMYVYVCIEDHVRPRAVPWMPAGYAKSMCMCVYACMPALYMHAYMHV